MSRVEIIAYTGEDVDGKFGEIERFYGTTSELEELEKNLQEDWKMFGTEITIVYKGENMEAANETIKGLPKVSEDVNL